MRVMDSDNTRTPPATKGPAERVARTLGAGPPLPFRILCPRSVECRRAGEGPTAILPKRPPSLSEPDPVPPAGNCWQLT